MPKIAVLSPLAACLVFMIAPQRSPADYLQPAHVVDASGGRGSNMVYSSVSAVGQGTSIGTSTNASYVNYSGFLHPEMLPVLSLDPISQTYGSSGGDGCLFVTANVTWTVSENLSWVTITSGSTGTHCGSITYSLSENKSSSPRSGNLYVVEENLTIVFTIYQKGAGSFLFILR